jgi:hypothetical protein
MLGAILQRHASDAAWKPQRGTSGATVLVVKGALYIF